MQNQILNKKNAVIVMEDIPLLPETAELAELIGIVLGDGSFYVKDGSYQFDIAFDKKEEAYLDFVEDLVKKIVEVRTWRKRDKTKNCIHLKVCNKKDVLLLLRNTIKIPGDKVKNEVTVPQWVFKRDDFKRTCIRGLIDTDGSVFRMSKRDSHLIRIGFKNVNKKVLDGMRRMLVELNFHPSKIICGNAIFLSRQSEITRYKEEIGFNNQKNLNRYKLIAPSSSGQEVAPLL